MTKETIHGHEVEVHDMDSHTIQQILHNWKNYPQDFDSIRHAVKNDANQKIHIGNAVFERRDGKYILRHSSQSY